MADLYNSPSAPPPSAAGLSDNVAGGLAYITIIPAIVFLVLDPYKRSPFVRFHCFQCLFTFVVQVVLGILRGMLFSVLGSIGALILGLLSLVIFIFLVIACVQAFLGKRFVIPGIGPLAQQFAARV